MQFKQLSRKALIAAAVFGVSLTSITYYAYAYPFGINHTTLKDLGAPGEGQGCWCHTPTASDHTTVTISSEATFEPNHTYPVMVTVTNATERFAGFNLAAKYGTLSVAESGTQLMDAEMTHSTPRSLTGGSVTFTLNYTTPADRTVDTLFATGNAVNGNGQNDGGDQWNWSPNFVVHIGGAGVADAPMAASHLKLWPNPAGAEVHVDRPGTFTYSVLDAAGRTVRSGAATDRLELSTTGLTRGAYSIVTLNSEGSTETSRFVVR